MTDHHDVLVVGAGHGGAQAAAVLRQRGFTGSIGLLGDETEYPYERPPLSKEYLAGDKSFDRILLRPETFWAEKRIDLLLGARVTAVDAQAHRVTLADGSTRGYGALIWAAGGAARRLSCEGHHLVGVHTVRSRSDVDRLSGELAADPRVVVIGGGYIGLEAAAVLVKRGLSVTLLETQDRVLARVAGEPLSRFYEAQHRAHGVDLRLGVTVESITGDDRVTGVRLGDGSVLPADLVIVGIGIVPSIGPLVEAGAASGNGVLVDAFCRTSLADIYAIGDCAAHPSRFADGAVMRIESVQNAVDQATTAVRALMGDAVPYTAVPWFWSNQYDLKLQTVGLSVGYDRAIRRGDPDSGAFSVVYTRRGQVIALDCVNTPRDFVQGKALVVSGLQADPAQLADPSVALKSLAGMMPAA